ncbi:MAG: CsgG/HfaB family protein, partial [Flavobacteriales bacterium]|nr:CsgG/HfaB family protein [Flavobacteriales bacterium]
MPHRPHRPLLRPLLGLAVGLLIGPAAAQHAFNDSIAAAAARMAAHLHAAGRARVAVTDVTAPGGAVPAATASYVEEVLVMRLSGAPGITVVERRQLDRVLEEQRRTAAGTFDDDQAIELGRLLAADAIITGRLFTVDKKLHVMLRALDTGTGTLVGTAETITAFPKGKGPAKDARERQKADPVRMRRERTPSERNSILELRAMGTGARQWERLAGGATLELALRSHEKNGERIVPGKMAIGLQLTVLPRMAAWAEAPFEVGHIAGIQATDGYAGTPTVRFGGVDMAQGRLFLQPIGGAPLSFDAVTAPGGSGIVQVAHERYRLRNVRMDQAGFHIPLRIYLAQGYMYDNVPKLYMDLGFGMDLALVRADHEITSTWVRLGADDLAYTVQEETFTMGKPGMG